MKITVLSGKGGVGKSMISSSLAILFSEQRDVVAVDCDVDAPNLAIWLGIDTASKDKTVYSKKISTVQKPFVNNDKCISCGTCVESCNFNALKMNENNKAELISYRCEGCGLCEIVCPNGAIGMRDVSNCTLNHYESEFGFPVVQGQIAPGEAESGEAVTRIREYADKLSKNENTLYIQDAAAGIGCPVIASIVGSDYVIGVAEPSKSSISDLKRVLEVVKNFNIDYGVVINKFDLNKDLSLEIKDWVGDSFLGHIGYDEDIVSSVVNFNPVVTLNANIRDEVLKIKEEFLKRVSF